MVTKSEAVKNFLMHRTHPDLASLYHLGMEVQVNAAQDGGVRVEGEYLGREWHGWTDGLNVWKSFRIPYNAKTEPEYTDTDMRYDLAIHAEGIGMTGWNWQQRHSCWVAFDFDSIVGHSEKHATKLSSDQLQEVRDAAFSIDWVTIRKSTSGKGLHLYVFLDNVPTKNHNEHAALARSILGLMSAITGFDFKSRVDTCGGNMWVWHRKKEGTDGLSLLKSGSILYDVPPNWRDHVKVITGRKKIGNTDGDTSPETLIEQLAGQSNRIKLDEDHKKLIEFLRTTGAHWWWDSDLHMLITHTLHLQEAFEELHFKGYFKTISIKGSDYGRDHNCFLFPLRRGAWSVRRYSQGVQEHESWEQDGQGWTRCYINKEPDLGNACRTHGGIEDPAGGFIFRSAEYAIKAALLLGVEINVGPHQINRKAKLKEHKDGRLLVEIDWDAHDSASEMQGYLQKKDKWIKIFNQQVTPPNESDTGNFDDIVRHLVTMSGENSGWRIKSGDEWRQEPLEHVRVALSSLGMSAKEITEIIGSSVFKCWKLVNKPFQPEYPGDREWNSHAAQLRFAPTQSDKLYYPTWMKVLDHCGKELDLAVSENAWCRANGILTGSDYLKCWAASLIQNPLEQLPYLFFWSREQCSGKSTFHEALSLLMTRGHIKAEAALQSTGNFNGELLGAVLCVIEEVDLNRNKQAYNKIKDWVTSQDLLIHPKTKTPFHVPNSTHWIQCANDHNACPIFPGDTRITMIHVNPLEPTEMIPKRMMLLELEKEAPDFVAAILSLDLPPTNDRLRIPVITTEEKLSVERSNRTELEEFVDEHCTPVQGLKIKFSDFYDKFITSLDSNEIEFWTKRRVSKEIPIKYPKGRLVQDNQLYIGNITWRNMPQPEKLPARLIVKDKNLIHAES